jgi:hypothetical protein
VAPFWQIVATAGAQDSNGSRVVVVTVVVVLVVDVVVPVEVDGAAILQNIPMKPTGHMQMARFGPIC